jgi:hypothetical protein
VANPSPCGCNIHETATATREIGVAPQITLIERHEDGELLNAMRPQIGGLDLVEGTKAPEEERRREPKPALQMTDGSHVFARLWLRLRLVVGHSIISRGDDLLCHEQGQGPLCDLGFAPKCSWPPMLLAEVCSKEEGEERGRSRSGSTQHNDD